MIISDQEVSWAYLLGPCFQLQNTKGVPLTGGYIEVYIHGTRDKYYCASDFAGTLHPFQIPLDSLGSNIVLASTEQAYDVYVYNRFGSLIMSRYNVIPVNGTSEGGGGTSNISITSSDGTITVTDTIDPETGIKTYDLSVPWASGDASYWHGRGASNQGQLISDTDTHVLAISEHAIDHEGGDITVGSDGKFHLKEGVYFWTVNVDLYSDSLSNNTQQIYINSNINRASYKMDMTRDNQHSVSFSGITVATQDDFQEGFTIKTEGQPIRAAIYEVAIHKLNPKVLGTKYETGYGIVIEDDTISVDPEVIPSVSTVSGMIQEAVTSIPEYTAGEYIKIEDNEISVTGLQPAGDYLTPEDLNGYATESFVTGYVDQAISEIPEQVQSDWDQTDDTAVDYIKNKPDLDIYATHDEVTSAVTSIDLSDYATHTEVYEATVTAVQVATGAIPEEEEVEFEEIDLNDYALASAIPDVSDFTTHNEVYEATVTAVQVATGAIPDVSDFATHEDVFESAVTSIQLVTGMIPDVSDFITHDEVNTVSGEIVELTTEIVNNVSGDIIETVNNVSSVLHEEIQNIPEQVQSDWDQTDDTQVDYIKNKPDLDIYATHDEVNTVSSTIIETVNNVSGEIVETVNNVSSVLHEEMIEIGQAATGAIPDVSDFTTHDEVHESIVSAVEYVTGIIPDVSDYATNSDVFESAVTSIQLVTGLIPTDYATDEELQDAIELVTGKIPELPDEEEVEFEEINLSDYALASAIPDVSDFTTHEDVFESAVTSIQLVTGMIPEAQVQSDWDQTDDTQVDYIKNKPNEYTVVAGQNIGIIVDNNDLIISASGTDLTGYVTDEQLQDAIELVTGKIPDVSDFVTEDQVTALLPDEEEVEFEEINLSDYALASAIPDVSNLATKAELQDGLELVTGLIPTDYTTHDEVFESSVTAIQMVTAIIPEAQVQSDWAETDNTDPSYIQNKPNTTNLVAGDNINIIESSNNLVISCTAIPVVTGFATKEELQDAVEVVTGMIPESEEVQFEELNITQFAQVSAIPVVTGFATKSELSDVESTIPTVQLNGDDQVTAINNHEIAGTGGTTYTAGDYISIKNDEISVTGLEPLPEIVEMEVLPISAGNGISIESSATGIVISVTGGGEAQVQSDWAQNDDTQVDYIKNKPAEYTVVAGQNIGIMIDNNDLVISASGTDLTGYVTDEQLQDDLELVTGMIPDVSDFVTEDQVTALLPEEEEVEFEELDLNNYALASAVPTVQLNSNDQVTGINNYPLAVGGTSYTAGDYISIKNDEISVTGLEPLPEIVEMDALEIKAGTNIAIVTGVSDITISVTGIEIPDVSNLATKAELQDGLELVTGMIPEAQVQSDWTEADSGAVDYIKNKPQNLVQDASYVHTDNNFTNLDKNKLDGIEQGATKVLVTDVPGQHQPLTIRGGELRLHWGDGLVCYTPSSGDSRLEVSPTIIDKLDGIEPGAEVNVQADWAVTAVDSPAYIQNKPDYTTFEDVVAIVSGVTGVTEYGQFYSTNITSAATMNKIKGTIEVTNDGKIKLKKGSSYHVTVRGRYNQTTAANTYGDISYIEYITNQSIHVNVDNTIAGAQYFELSYDLYKLNNDSNYYVYFSMNGGTVNDLFIEIHSLDGMGSSGGGDSTSYTAGNCIDITSNVISWETTAGITDIQMVTALPANPVSSILYIIPEA